MEDESTEANLNRLNITKKHLDILLQYMEKYPRLALATARNREAHVQARHMWEKIAWTLNKIDSNVTKTGREWKRYWVGRKFKARRRYATICQCASDGTACPVSLDTIDQKIVNIVTDDDGTLLPINSICEKKQQYPDTGGEKTNKGGEEGCAGEGEGEGSPQEQLVDVSIKREDPIRVEPVTCYTDVPRKIKKRTDTLESNPENKRNQEKKYSKAEPKSRIEDLRRKILEFELYKQRELFEIEKCQAGERHRAEMQVLELKKQLLMRDLNNYNI